MDQLILTLGFSIWYNFYITESLSQQQAKKDNEPEFVYVPNQVQKSKICFAQIIFIISFIFPYLIIPIELQNLFSMNHRKTASKCSFLHNRQQSIEYVSFLKQNLFKKLVKQYSTSQVYFHTKVIDDVIEKKQGDRNCILVNDHKFDDSKQYMEKYYFENQSCHELPELLQYYKYYTQDSICFLNREFAFLAHHHDKKKAVLYQQLKRQLNISDSQQTLQEVTSPKSQQKFQNILSGLQLTHCQDQSYLVAEVLKKLVQHYGPSRIKTINKIDSQFKFMTHNLTIGKSKNLTKEGPSIFYPKTMLQSTNTSVRNNCQIKMKKESQKNVSHRRFGSCQVNKSTVSRSSNLNTNTQKDRDKKSKIRRRKSAELLSYVDLNSGTPEGYKKSSIKTQQQLINSKVLNAESNFREKMQQLRTKIRKEKENLNKKPQSACIYKKKSKK